MDPECGREVNLVILGCADCISGRGEVTVIDVFSRGDKVLFGYGCTARNHGRRTASALIEERWRTTRQGEGGARTWLLLTVIVAGHGCGGGGGHTRTGAPYSPFVCGGEVLSVLLGE